MSLVAALVLALGFQAPDLVAQEQGAPTPAPQQQAPDIDISDAEMEQFVETYLDVEQIQMSLNEDLQNVQAAEEAQELQSEANAEMETVISEQGMEVERFSKIVQAINADPTLQEEFATKRMELTGEQ